jgi:hypothetical protein
MITGMLLRQRLGMTMERNVESHIPVTLLEKLTAVRSVLETHGAVQPHHGKYRLRFRAECDYGYTVHRSIALGREPGVIDAVEALLERWRTARRARDAEVEKNQTEALLSKRKDVLMANMFAALYGVGPRRQRQLREFYHECRRDPRVGLRYAVTGVLPPRKKIGRPRKLSWANLGHESEDVSTGLKQKVSVGQQP